ncbi:hypothetical protein G6M04_00520 [Agrobacterium rhizogenes]|uniref:hypothetical protein n=1 Tax=Rhizobium rhizogenes TaxID=359 RepID=UPI0015722003|nr:hypothetical protein [Rhizobium rhizogenes]NTG45838.1 hypothetical protein [Rhizobium rhizogenes]
MTETLNDPGQAAEALRSLIGDIVLMPGDKRGEVYAMLRGELFGILDFVRREESLPPDDAMLAVTARPRNQSLRDLSNEQALPRGGLVRIW